MACISCARGLHYECGMPCCCASTSLEDQASFSSNELIKERGRPYKPDDEITISAGRKRAAVEYSIDKTAPCEWRALANCGGGLHPIIGCNSGKQRHRHHGPVKDTARNEEGNVHRICETCHNRWHAANDKIYDAIRYEQLKHSPRPITIEERLESGNS